MTEDQPGQPASGDRDDQPGQGVTEPLPAPAQPPVPPPAHPAAGPPVLPPAYPAAGPPREALEGFWRRLVAAFLDWVLVGIVAAAIGELFGVQAPSPPPGSNFQPAPGPFVLVGLVYFTFFHATSAGQSIGNKIMGMRVLDADTGRSLPYVRAFVRALVSNLSAIVFFLGYLWALWEPRKRTWHDMVANSLVVRAGYYPPGEFGRPPPRRPPGDA